MRPEVMMGTKLEEANGGQEEIPPFARDVHLLPLPVMKPTPPATIAVESSEKTGLQVHNTL
jgi:hypothetical protein